MCRENLYFEEGANLQSIGLAHADSGVMEVGSARELGYNAGRNL